MRPQRRAARGQPTQANERAQGDLPAAFVVDAALGFAIEGLAELLAIDPALGEALAGEFTFEIANFDFAGGAHAGGAPAGGAHAGGARPQMQFQPFAFVLDVPLAAAAARGREAVIADRRAIAAEAPSAAAATAAYVAAATAHTNDPQNSHDTGVLASLRAVVDRLRADQGSGDKALPTLDGVIADIRRDGAKLSEGRPALVDDAVAVAERTRRGEKVLAIGATDEECLRRVWRRADDPRNAAARGQIRQAAFDALADAWEPGQFGGMGGGGRHIVCVNGRTTRILAALVLLDWDQRNWGVKTLEQFKNDVFARAAAVIARVAKEAAAGPDAGLRAAAAAWQATTPAALEAAGATDADSERLAAAMRAAVAADVDAFARESGLALAPPVIDAVKLEAQAAVA